MIVTDTGSKLWARRGALLLAVLMSGGHQLFPRVPMLAGLILLSLMLANPLGLLRRQLALAWLALLGAFAVIVLGGTAALDWRDTLIRGSNFVGALFLLNIYLDRPADTFADDLFALLKPMAWQAILTVLLAIVVPGAFATIALGAESGEPTIYNSILLIFTYQDVTDASSLLKRASGFFFEAGVFQFYLNLLLALALFRYRKAGVAVAALLGVMATQSTTGFLIASFLLVAAGLKEVARSRPAAVLAIVVAAPVVFAPMLYLTVRNVQEKTTGDLRGSAWSREYDTRTGINVALAHPLIGIGLDHGRYREESGQLGYRETELDADAVIGRATTNGLVLMLYSLGFPLAVLLFFGLARQRLVAGSFVAVVAAVSLATEAIPYTPLFLALILSGLFIRGERVAPAKLAPT